MEDSLDYVPPETTSRTRRIKPDYAVSPKVRCKSWKLPADHTLGYVGYQVTAPSANKVSGDSDDHILEKKLKKQVIIGYTGYLRDTGNIVGVPIATTINRETKGNIESDTKKDFQSNFRAYAKHMDINERYHDAVMTLLSRGQTQQMLLKIVQAKISQRVKSYAEQKIATKLLFEAFDFNKDGVLDEMEFRECLEKMNCQFDDVQSLALFALFDDNNGGTIEWREFGKNVYVANPKGGTATLPKQITDAMDTADWKLVQLARDDQFKKKH